MNIKPSDETIKHILLSGKQFVIPRFQREYSWEKKNYQEFLEDMIDNLKIENGMITHDQYFLGTMLFIGDITEVTDKEIYVVDGQQRLTTITILFSVISEKFKWLNEGGLSAQLFKYVMTKDDDDNDIRILKSKSHYPFFAYYIQDPEKSNPTEPSSEEEISIKETYDYFSEFLNEGVLKKYLERKYGKDLIDRLSFIDILKSIRDQVLNSTVIVISTKDEKQANKIFEILNAKGKRLAHVDLIKNKLFEILDKKEPADFAEETWKNIKNVLCSGKESIGLATFYRHYWISKYNKTPSTKLYDDFIKSKQIKTPDQCKLFLNDMLQNARCYMQIINPNLEDYDNRKEFAWLVQSLKNIINDFNIVQVRIALLAMFDIKNRDLITNKKFKKTIFYLEKFHFAYNAIMSYRANKLETIYSKFAIAIRNSSSKDETNNIVDKKLIAPLEMIYPTENSFCEKFVQLTYSKKNIASNIKTRYAINKFNSLYSEKELFEPDGSIEHLFPESNGGLSLNIGNLILLEMQINNDAGQKEYVNKVESYYSKSQYKWLSKFVAKYPIWNESMIKDRAVEMAKVFYYDILRSDLP